MFGTSPTDWSPEIADVHTSPHETAPKALEAAVGNAQFLVVAVDNQGDTGVYVGPAYSYYEFPVPVSARMTDKEWAQRVASGKLPPRPNWTRSFAPKAPAEARR